MPRVREALRGYDTLPARRWRAPGVRSARCYVGHAPRRVVCPEHGVKAEPVPWAWPS